MENTVETTISVKYKLKTRIIPVRLEGDLRELSNKVNSYTIHPEFSPFDGSECKLLSNDEYIVFADRNHNILMIIYELDKIPAEEFKKLQVNIDASKSINLRELTVHLKIFEFNKDFPMELTDECVAYVQGTNKLIIALKRAFSYE